ncbi:hypothetical protein BC749_101621 [Flavobacterium araucananum]|uniref:hypothetical protein n=1 Tax=Flavobacterium araucananum TaxID=946678 RepID=UPI000D7A136E|nr:hypothetical protein [Flavobacterium araucananum]PWK02555.1 hypothetical protein BC749_101621 [Flavobacterium araucananum]
MKKLFFTLFLISGAAFSQDMNVVKGNFDFLKDQKENKPEAQYVEEHKADLDKKAYK